MKPRALLVEDEALVAMMMEDLLADAGWEVAATFSNVAPALEWLTRQDSLDGAVLDINLGVETAFPVADALKARGAPFAFVTGYTLSPQAQGYQMPVLTKPVDEHDLGRVLAGFLET